MGYSDLEIQDGSNASVAYAQMIAPDTEKPDRERIRGALLDYCERDTQAIVRLLQVLLASSLTSPSQR
jgi:hypothetical protein